MIMKVSTGHAMLYISSSWAFILLFVLDIRCQCRNLQKIWNSNEESKLTHNLTCTTSSDCLINCICSHRNLCVDLISHNVHRSLVRAGNTMCKSDIDCSSKRVCSTAGFCARKEEKIEQVPITNAKESIKTMMRKNPSNFIKQSQIEQVPKSNAKESIKTVIRKNPSNFIKQSRIPLQEFVLGRNELDSRMPLQTPIDTWKIINLLEKYANAHNTSAISVLSNKSLCNMQFTVGTYACPMQVGNRIHEFLNAFAGAIITDRTLLWSYCTREYCKTPQHMCEESLSRAPWIASADDIRQRLQAAGCPFSKQNWAVVVPNHQKAPVAIEAMMACCGIDQYNATNLNFGTLERWEMFGTAFGGAVLGARARARSRLLYSNGEDYAYGALFRAAFEFSVPVKNFTSALIQDIFSEYESVVPPSPQSILSAPLPFGDGIYSTASLSATAGNNSIGLFSPSPPSITFICEAVFKKFHFKSLNSSSRTELSNELNLSVAAAASAAAATTSSNTAAAPTAAAPTAAAPTAANLLLQRDTEAYTPPLEFLSRLNDPHMLVLAIHVRHMPAGFQIADLMDSGEFHCIQKVLKQLVRASPVRIPSHSSRKNEADNTSSGSNTNTGFHSSNSASYNASSADDRRVDSKSSSFTVTDSLTAVGQHRDSTDSTAGAVSRRLEGLIEVEEHAVESSAAIKDSVQDRAATNATNKRRVSTPPNNSAGSKRECVILIASDRTSTYERLQDYSRSIGCLPIFTVLEPPNSEEQADNPGRSGARFRQYAKKLQAPAFRMGEHGTFGDSNFAIADLHLLSYAHAFIGSADPEYRQLSTFSLLINSLISTNGYRRIPEAYWLPQCGNQAFGAFVSDPITTGMRGYVPSMAESNETNRVDTNGGTKNQNAATSFKRFLNPEFRWNCGANIISHCPHQQQRLNSSQHYLLSNGSQQPRSNGSGGVHDLNRNVDSHPLKYGPHRPDSTNFTPAAESDRGNDEIQINDKSSQSSNNDSDMHAHSQTHRLRRR